MALQLGNTGGRLAAVCVCLGSTAACIGILSGCVGSGDDNGMHVIPGDGGDAAAGDATDGDARSSDAPSADAPDATFDAADAPNTPIDATLQDTGDAAVADPPSALLSASAIEFGAVGCGAMPVTKTLTITNTG
ncbi:MAG: hypothetical protein M3O46_06175, partial [Myxococcota bacterium]|nr:hypothetical protein [Myxococcota bacterium]